MFAGPIARNMESATSLKASRGICCTLSRYEPCLPVKMEVGIPDSAVVDCRSQQEEPMHTIPLLTWLV